MEDPEFKGGLGYVVRPCLKSNSSYKKKNRKKEKKRTGGKKFTNDPYEQGRFWLAL